MPRPTVGLFVTLALGFLLAPLTGVAQRSMPVPRIGVLNPRAGPVPSAPLDGFRQGLRDLGYVEGQTIILEYRWGDGQEERLRDLAAELVQLPVQVILAVSSTAVRSARHATQTIPIVAVDMETDPVTSGLAASLAQPGANVTGVFLDLPEFNGKWLELLREVVPDLTRVAVLWDGATAVVPRKAMEVAAQALRVPLHMLELRGPDEFEEAFGAATRGHAGALIVLQSPIFGDHFPRIAQLAFTHRLPAIAMFREFPAAQGLMSYGPNLFALFRRAAVYVDKILKGAQPGDLPVERPMQFGLVMNLKTAMALGLTIPPTLLFQADEVIQ
jgi:putative tryptophan/tyrosine transport system substrate-binding protein